MKPISSREAAALRVSVGISGIVLLFAVLLTRGQHVWLVTMSACVLGLSFKIPPPLMAPGVMGRACLILAIVSHLALAVLLRK